MKPQIEPVIVFISGESAPLCIEFVWEMLRSTRFKMFIVVTIGLFALIQPYQPVTLQRWQAITIIAVVGVMVFICYMSAFWFFAIFTERLGLRRLRTVWLLLTSSLVASFAGQWALPLFGEVPKPVGETLLVWVFHFLMFTGLEIMFATMILPEILTNLAIPQKISTSVETPSVTDIAAQIAPEAQPEAPPNRS